MVRRVFWGREKPRKSTLGSLADYMTARESIGDFRCFNLTRPGMTRFPGGRGVPVVSGLELGIVLGFEGAGWVG